ncbi:MAG: PhoH family protein [Proteobacteria bacterium]|nr:PhoH family protein [Pseudomonadota bacterium]
MKKEIKERYILDASVLLYEPDSIFAYPDAQVIVPISVIEEIDHFKKEFNETGRNARLVSQMLDKIRTGGSLTEGIELSNGGILRVFIVEEKDVRLPAFSNLNKSSNKVLVATILIHQRHPENTYLVTNDINLRVRVSALGINVMAYEERLPNLEKFYAGVKTRVVEEKAFEKLVHGTGIKIEEGEYYANQSVLVKMRDSDKQLACRFQDESGKLLAIQLYSEGIWGIKARNMEQEIALDLLMDPSVHIVILAGKAGTGKTLLALAVALELMLSANQYQKILVSRPIFPMGRDMGYLPGDIEKKMEPWMQPIFDNLEFLSSNRSSPASKTGGYQRLLDMGLVELEPLTYIRGRSIPHRFMIVDEAQNLTPHELKTIVTRVGAGTKLVLTGDPYQIDNPYVDTGSNGLSHVIEKFQNYGLSGHVNLIHGVRSKLAELASNIL